MIYIPFSSCLLVVLVRKTFTRGMQIDGVAVMMEICTELELSVFLNIEVGTTTVKWNCRSGQVGDVHFVNRDSAMIF